MMCLSEMEDACVAGYRRRDPVQGQRLRWIHSGVYIRYRRPAFNDLLVRGLKSGDIAEGIDFSFS